MDHVGPMARSAADAAAMLGAIAGYDPEDPTSLQAPVPHYLADIDGGVRGIRIGIDRRLIAAGADADMVRVTEDAATVFAGLGAQLREIVFPSPDQIVRDAVLQCAAEAASGARVDISRASERVRPDTDGTSADRARCGRTDAREGRSPARRIQRPCRRAVPRESTCC
jgi:amidase